MLLNISRCVVLARRLCHVRARFAPSPTGELHLGGLRTAFYNYLLARKTKGKLILRIEDTDQRRTVPGAADSIEQVLSWAGITFDESPSRGGPCGPYVQSKRAQLYVEQAERLRVEGKAYPCFCSPQRLRLLQREALRSREAPRYDNRCRYLTEEEVNTRIEQGLPYVVRFKLDVDSVSFDDAVFGRTSQVMREQHGDFIILKGDGLPTYHLASVVDDHLMGVSHVMRGWEWFNSTGKHLALYSALGWEAPRLIHLPLLLNKDGSKLSKRQGNISVEHFKRSGYLPDAVLNFITHVGGGFVGRTSSAVLSVDQLVEMFEHRTINAYSARLDMSRLDDFNRQVLQSHITDSTTRRHYVAKLREIVVQKFGPSLETSELQSQVLSDGYIQQVLLWSSTGRINRLSELVDPQHDYIWLIPPHTAREVQKAANKQRITSEMLEESFEIIRDAISSVPADQFNGNIIANKLRDVCSLTKVNVMTLLRAALTGLKIGPPVGEILEVFGREHSLLRLDHHVREMRSMLHGSHSTQNERTVKQ